MSQRQSDTGFRLRRFGLLDHLPTSDNMWMVVERPDQIP